jgi:endonuclease/exonuclease/phosphatase family metal-dependent hydrolase
VAGIIVVQTGVASGADQSTQTPLSVMTRNLDLGSDLGPVMAATSQADFLHAVTFCYDEIAASNIPERADGVAAEIGLTMPLVVSLQEVSLIQRLVPTASGLSVDSQIDQLGELRAALARRGLNYALAVDASEFDVTVPSDGGFYVRLLDQNVILTRADLPAKQFSAANAQSGHFSDQLMLPTAVGAVESTRGWASTDVTYHGTTVRVIDTHLEQQPFPDGAAQAGELLAGPGDTSLPVVIAADLNSGPGTGTAAYDVIASAMTDTWLAAKPHQPGMTWALFGEDGLPWQTTPSQRIDLVFARGLLPVTDVLVGTDDRTPSGLYPSDHAGVVARLG